MEESATTSEKTIDPVCCMDVEPGRTRLVASYQGHSYWFCSRTCLEAFEKNPQKYLEAKHPKRKGWFGRYLERLGKANEKQFGKRGPRCH